MTKLIEKIRADQLTARKEKNAVVASLLTTLIGETRQVADKAAEKEPCDDQGNIVKRDPTDLEVVTVVKRFLSKNEELQQDLQKLSDEETRKARLLVAAQERAVLNQYLPKQLDQEDLVDIINLAVSRGTPCDMGSLQKFLKENHAGTYDGKLATTVIKSLL